MNPPEIKWEVSFPMRSSKWWEFWKPECFRKLPYMGAAYSDARPAPCGRFTGRVNAPERTTVHVYLDECYRALSDTVPEELLVDAFISSFTLTFIHEMTHWVEWHDPKDDLTVDDDHSERWFNFLTAMVLNPMSDEFRMRRVQ